MRERVKDRKQWQQRGINIFESFYYTVGRFVFIFASFLMAQASQYL